MKRRHNVTPARAIVDYAGAAIGGGAHWTVTVVTAPGWKPPKQVVYTIRAFSDSLAAIEGLRRFEEETATPPQPLVS